MVDSTKVLEKYNNDQMLGANRGGAELRNPTNIDINDTTYRINQLCYPDNVSVAADLQHYITFYVNVRGKTKFKDQNKVDMDVGAGWQNRGTGQGQADTAVAGATIAGAVVGKAAADALGGALVDRIVKSGAVTKMGAKGVKFAKSAVGVVAGAATGKILAQTATSLSDVLSVDTPVRITDAIILPIEKPPTVSYGMKYSETDLGVLGGLYGGSSAIESSNYSKISEAGQQMALNIAKIPAIFGMSSPANAFKLAGKVQTNPFKEVIFESINYRHFAFKYTFLPRNETEVNNVQNIINLFKFHMHPELSAGGLFYVYPSEFEMVYYYKGAENTYVNKISTCVLTDMKVQYGGDYFSTFESGAPAEISISLKFKELELLTKERILKGY